MFTYEEATHFLIDNLNHDIHLHLSGDFLSIGKNYDYFDVNLPRKSDSQFNKLFIGLNFWDSWIDARNHDWMFYEGISKSDWPELAKIIIADIKADREITN